MKNLITIIFLGVLLFSCGKKVTVKGRVYNPLDNKGIEGIDVQLRREKFNLFSYDGAGSKSIEEATTDKDGNYLIEYRHKSRSYRLFFTFDKEKYISTVTDQYNISQENEILDLPLLPVGYLKEKIKNTSCQDGNDLLNIVKTHEVFDNYYGNSVISWEGCVDYEFTQSIDGSPEGYVRAPMGWHYANGTVIKNGVETTFKDSIYVNPGEFNTWLMEY